MDGEVMKESNAAEEFKICQRGTFCNGAIKEPRSYRCYILLPKLFAPSFLLDSTNSLLE